MDYVYCMHAHLVKDEGATNITTNNNPATATRTIFHRGHAAVVFYGGLSPEKAISLSKYKFN